KEKVIKNDGTSLFYTYDPLGRLETYISCDHSLDYRYHYNLRNQILHVEDHSQQAHSHFTYDARGRLVSETLSTGISIHYAYDMLDRVIRLTLPDSSEVHYTFDAVNLKKIDRNQNQVCLYTHRYDTFDLAGLNLKSTAINQQENTARYDLQKRPLAI